MKYADDKLDYATYINSIEKIIFLAYIDKQIAGQVILRANWNHFANIKDIAVDLQL